MISSLYKGGKRALEVKSLAQGGRVSYWRYACPLHGLVLLGVIADLEGVAFSWGNPA